MFALGVLEDIPRVSNCLEDISLRSHISPENLITFALECILGFLHRNHVFPYILGKDYAP